jgi:hypothetical protein
MRFRSAMGILLVVALFGDGAWAGPRAAAKPRNAGKSRRAPIKRSLASPPAPASEVGPTIEFDSAAVEDLDVSKVLTVVPTAKSSPASAPDTVVAGDDGERFHVRLELAAAAHRYLQSEPAPFQMSNGYVNGTIEISRRVFSRWLLALEVDSPLFSLDASPPPANFGPLFGRFSVGRPFSFAERWEALASLAYLFVTTAGTTGGLGFGNASGVQGTLRARFVASDRRRLEIESAVALLGSRQAGIVTGDRYLGLQVSHLWLDTLRMAAVGPFVAAEEMKATFPGRRIASARYRVGLLAEW